MTLTEAMKILNEKTDVLNKICSQFKRGEKPSAEWVMKLNVATEEFFRAFEQAKRARE